MIEVVEAGRWTTIQDRGRPGLERFGIPSGGAADWFAAAVANRLVGNHEDAALLECTAAVPTLLFEADAVIALTGGQSAGVANWQAVPISRGSSLAVGTIAPGLRSYIAVRGGIDVPLVLGSRSFCQRGTFGGGFGRPLAKGDGLAIGRMTELEAIPTPWPESHRLQARGPWEVRVIAGPQRDAFSADALQRLGATACRVTPEIDRMGLRLETPGLRLQPQEILTVPMTAGSIQVTPSGGLIVLHVDHQSTGGYPVIATVISADLPLLAQARPGDTVRFRSVDLAEAARAWRRLIGWLELDR
ncbi:MAG TPA: biotin-dependent carboxyltransferase family protein [Candidatus Dormibacteraeota bacterium]|nr:biotin-dependent carboxyltransferase family protein [Candidatus Dormibacteraeota bacterium]